MMRLLVLLLLCLHVQAGKITDINLARAWLDQYNAQAEVELYTETLAHWNYNTNITDYNNRIAVSMNQPQMYLSELVLCHYLNI